MNNFFPSYFSFISTPAHGSIVNSRCIVMLNQRKMDLNCSIRILKRDGLMFKSATFTLTKHFNDKKKMRGLAVFPFSPSF